MSPKRFQALFVHILLVPIQTAAVSETDSVVTIEAILHHDHYDVAVVRPPAIVRCQPPHVPIVPIVD